MACCHLFEDLPSGSPHQVTYPRQATCHRDQWGSHRVGAQLSRLTQPALVRGWEAGHLGDQPYLVPEGGPLAPGERDRTEKKKVVVTYTIFFCAVAVPNVPFKISLSLPFDYGLPFSFWQSPQRWETSLAKLLSLFAGMLFSSSQEFHLKVLAVPVRVGSYLPAPPLGKAQMGLRGGAPLSGTRPA